MSEEAPTRILIVDDEESLRFSLSRALTKSGYAVETVADAKAAIDRLAQAPFDVVLTDLVMPHGSGLDVLAAVHELDRDCVVLLMTAHGSVQNAIDALRRGAFDYLTKPFETSDLLVRIERGLERRTLDRENRKLRFLVNKKMVEGAGEEGEGGIGAARREWEKRYLADLLRETRGNVTKAAGLAQISRPNFHKKLKQLGINAADFKRRSVS